MTDTPKPGTSVEAVELIARRYDDAEDPQDQTAATLRQLRKELTEAREKQRDRELRLINYVRDRYRENLHAAYDAHSVVLLDAFNAAQEK